MAQTGYTPIQLYYSTTTSNTPSAGNLASGELAINITDGKLFYKDNGGVVRVIAQTSSVTNVASISFGSTGLTPSTATTGAVTVAGTLAAANGGTGQSTYTTGDLLYATGSTALSKLGIGTNGQILTSTGTAPQWSNLSGVTVTTFSAGTTGFTPSSATSGAVTLAGTLATTNGGTGLTSFTANGVVYASSTSALTTGSALTFDGATLATKSVFFATDSQSYFGDNGVIGGGAADGNTTIRYFNGKYLAFKEGTSEQMRLTSTGLGIGTSSPSQKLHVVAAGGYNATFSENSANNVRLQFYIDANETALVSGYNTTAKPMTFYTGGSLRATLDSSGNLGLGVTPTNVVGTRKLEIGGTTNAAVVLSTNSSNAAARNWATAANFNAFGDYVFLQSNALGGDPTTAGTTRMTLDASGNLGIGTSSPASTLDVRTSTGATIIAGRTSNVGATSVPGVLNFTAPNASGSARTWAGIRSVVGTATTGSESSSIIFSNQVAGAYTDTLTLDSSGNLGLGVTPSAWGSGWRALQIGALSNFVNNGSGNTTDVWHNGYVDTGGNVRYLTTAAASFYRLEGNTFKWFNAPSGTAGNTISFTQAMTLDASGNLGVGTTSPASFGKLAVAGTIAPVSPDGQTQGVFLAENTGKVTVGGYNGSITNFLVFTAGGATERARIDSAGNLGIGITPTTILDIGANNNTPKTISLRYSTVPAYLSNSFDGTLGLTTLSTNSFNTSNGSSSWSAFQNTGYGNAAVQIATATTGADIRFLTAAAANTNPTERARITSGGNVSIGGSADRGTTVGSAALQLFNGTAPAGTLTNGVSLYSQSGDLRFMDAAGNAYPVGFRNIPQSGSAKTGSYTLATTDVGEYIQVGSGGSITIPDATFATGDVVSVFNNTTGNITITCSITTAYIAGTDSDKATMTLATRGVATILFISSTVCVVTGNVT